MIDSSVAGLGGCPYAKGASGNVATEDVLYMCELLGVEHGVNFPKLINAGQSFSRDINRTNMAKVKISDLDLIEDTRKELFS